MERDNFCSRFALQSSFYQFKMSPTSALSVYLSDQPTPCILNPSPHSQNFDTHSNKCIACVSHPLNHHCNALVILVLVFVSVLVLLKLFNLKLSKAIISHPPSFFKLVQIFGIFAKCFAFTAHTDALHRFYIPVCILPCLVLFSRHDL